MKKSLQPIYDLTALSTNCPPQTVKKIVSHQVEFLRTWIREPYKYAHLQLPYLGRYEIRSSSVYVKLRKLLKQLREEPTEELVDEFRFWWEFRLIANEFKKSRKK